MRSHFFISRPVLAIVLSAAIFLFGLFGLKYLPVDHLPDLSPPAISVSATLPGANAETIALSIAKPLEKAILGTPNMLYMSSDSASGSMTLTAYFQPGTDPIEALDEIQRRIDKASYSLPEEVKKQGLSVSQSSSETLLLIALQDQTGLSNASYLTNYALLHIVPELQSIPGVGSVRVINAGEYALRIWLQPDRLAQLNLSPIDVKNAILEQNAIYNIGEVGQEPSPPNTKLTIPVSAAGLLKSVSDFENIILKADNEGSTVLLKDVSRIELGAENYNLSGNFNGKEGAFISVSQNINGNALSVSKHVKSKLKELSRFFSPGFTYSIPYDTTHFIKNSIHKVEITLLTAALIVSAIIYIFLHNFWAVLIPLLAMLVSLSGTFFAMYLFGYSINILTLFGMILSIGIVVDDAIIVVEKVQWNRKLGLTSFVAVKNAMKELTPPIIAIVFALFAVFIPVTFMGGIVGQLYKQFAVTLAISVVLSGFVALTLSPALAVLFFEKKSPLSRWGERLDRFLARETRLYVSGVDWLLRHKRLGIGLWIAITATVCLLYRTLPHELIPAEDQGSFLISATLPPGASLPRTKSVVGTIEEILEKEKGIQDTISFAGLKGTNSALFYVTLKDWSQRKKASLHAQAIIENLNKTLSKIPDAEVYAFSLPAIPNTGNSDLYQFWLLNEGQWTQDDLQQVADQIVEKGRSVKEFSYLLSSAKALDSFGIYIDVNKTQAKALGVRLEDLFYTLQILFGSVYVNDFSDLGRLSHVILQAESSWRSTTSSQLFKTLFVPSASGKMIPLNTLVHPRFSKESSTLSHYNGHPATSISVARASSSEKALSAMEEIAIPLLPPGMSFAWSGSANLASTASQPILFALLGGIVMLFLILAALYGRWILPLTVLSTIPFAILGALLAIWARGIAMDLYFQVGLLTSIGISAKNTILIIEAARLYREEGMSIVESAEKAARIRFRPILLTSLSLALAVFPLTISQGAGSASQHSMGIGVLGGMLIGSLLSLFFAPLFFSLFEREKQ